jgi:hypothetical protein
VAHPFHLSLGDRPVDQPPQLLADERAGFLFGLASQLGVPAGKATGEAVQLRLKTLDHLGLHPVDAAGGLDLALDPRLQPEQPLQFSGGWQHRGQEDLAVGAAQADDPTVALYDSLRVPRHVVGDDRLRLLQVLAL